VALLKSGSLALKSKRFRDSGADAVYQPYATFRRGESMSLTANLIGFHSEWMNAASLAKSCRVATTAPRVAAEISE
jgi:hypothetical protein